ncbi:MAG: aspartate/glutamate racemase family protein [Pseudorhodobacter sp.]
MSGPIVVINPNSNGEVTAGLDTALAAFRLSGGPTIECLTLTEGPFGIESQRDVDSVALPLSRLMESRVDAAAFVIACYSDPGIDLCRSIARVPVFGIQESGVLAAMTRGDRFGVIAIAGASILRHRRYMRRMGVLERLAGERALNMSVAETASGDGTFARLVEVGTALRDQDEAEVLVLGCAGMARHRAGLQDKLGLPVIDPTQAAVTAALGSVLLQG